MTFRQRHKLCVIQWQRSLLECIVQKRGYNMIPLKGLPVQHTLF